MWSWKQNNASGYRKKETEVLNTGYRMKGTEMGEIADLLRVYEMLEDKTSRDIYRMRLNWMLSKDDSFITEILKKYMPVLAPSMRTVLTDSMDDVPPDKPVILYGAGSRAVELQHLWREKMGGRVIGFCDRDVRKQKEGYMGYPVMAPEALAAYRPVSIVILSCRYEREIRTDLHIAGFCDDEIYSIPAAYQESESQYFDDELIRYEKEGEIFVDAGCFDLGTVRAMKRKCRVKKVYAFEPDPENYLDCMAIKEKLGFVEVELFPYGTWCECAELSFRTSGSGSHIEEGGAGHSTVKVCSIDSVIPEWEKVTYIKMDVEGAELRSLEGAKRTILRNKPKLAVCIYHRPEDMVAIPLYIKSLVPDYRIYVRHYANDATETVLYAVP